MSEQVGAAEDLSGRGGEEGEEVELPGGEGDELAVDGDFSRGAVDHERPEREPRRRGRRAGAPQHRAHAGDELSW